MKDRWGSSDGCDIANHSTKVAKVSFSANTRDEKIIVFGLASMRTSDYTYMTERMIR